MQIEIYRKMCLKRDILENYGKQRSFNKLTSFFWNYPFIVLFWAETCNKTWFCSFWAIKLCYFLLRPWTTQKLYILGLFLSKWYHLVNIYSGFGDIDLWIGYHIKLIFHFPLKGVENPQRLVEINLYIYITHKIDLSKQLKCLSESAQKVEKHELELRAIFQKNTNISKSSIFHDLEFYTSFLIIKLHFLR